jgi:hypothetical protein
MMATAAAGNRLPMVTRAPGRRYDHFFFSGMALLLLATVFVGFARSYYLAGMMRATLPSVIIHLHGAAFSCWILVLIAQTSLVAVGRVDIHRRLGVFGFLLACAMVVLGVLAGTNSLARGFAPPGLDAATFYVIPISDMLIFPTLIFFAFRDRSSRPQTVHPDCHPCLDDRAHCTLAVGRGERESYCGSACGLLLFAPASGLRPVVHPQSPSSNAMGRRVSHLHAADTHTHRKNGRMARLRRLGAIDSTVRPERPVGSLYGYDETFCL